MTRINPQSSPLTLSAHAQKSAPAFGGVVSQVGAVAQNAAHDAAAAVTPSLEEYTRQLPSVKKLATKFVNFKDSGTGNSGIAFLQDTLSVWAPKSLLTRSLVDFVEMSYLEFVESALFYFSSSNAGALLHKAYKKALPNGRHGVTPDHLTTPLKNLYNTSGKLVRKGLQETVENPEQLRRITATKAGIIIASVGAVGMAAEYALSFAKNLMTKHVFKVEEFKKVANLSDDNGKNPEAMAKSSRRIRESAVISAGLVGLAGVVAALGHRSPLLSKGLEKFVSVFDFKFAPVLNKKTGQTVMKYKLGRGQLTAIIAAGMTSYVDAARDHLERMEVATRVLLTGPYLASGGSLFSIAALKLLKNKYKDSVIIQDKSHPNWAQKHTRLATKDMQTVFNEVVETELAKLGKTAERLTGAERTELYNAVRNNPAIKGKLTLTWGPLLFGMATIGLGVTGLMRYWTAQRYKRQQAEAAANPDQAALPPQPPPLVSQATANAFSSLPGLLAGDVRQKSFAEFTRQTGFAG
ncbi:MAG: hypothetical protein AB7P76_04390 [Candidatus Melainabacteria bacterium]